MTAYTQKDYEAIEAAVLESPRGRWFLGEFARRNRAADTIMLLEAIRKLERGVAESPAHRLTADLAAELRDLSDTIGRGGDEIPEAVAIKEKIDGLLARHCETDAREPTGENLSFFAGDEDLFEVAPAASAPALTVVGDQQERTIPARKATEARGDPKDRIVFIRRASSEETSIPLADEAEPANRSQPGS